MKEDRDQACHIKGTSAFRDVNTEFCQACVSSQTERFTRKTLKEKDREGRKMRENSEK